MKTLKSNFFPEMNPFLDLLGGVLSNLPNNPKPNCDGFCIAHYDHKKQIIIVEKLGEIYRKKEFKYSYLATKKVTEILYYDVSRSKDFQNKSLEQFPGGVRLCNDSAGVHGHDFMVNEAIATLWLIARDNLFKNGSIRLGSIEEDVFWDNISLRAKLVHQTLMPDNPWLLTICNTVSECLKVEI